MRPSARRLEITILSFTMPLLKMQNAKKEMHYGKQMVCCLRAWSISCFFFNGWRQVDMFCVYGQTGIVRINVFCFFHSLWLWFCGCHHIYIENNGRAGGHLSSVWNHLYSYCSELVRIFYVFHQLYFCFFNAVQSAICFKQMLNLNQSHDTSFIFLFWTFDIQR